MGCCERVSKNNILLKKFFYNREYVEEKVKKQIYQEKMKMKIHCMKKKQF